MIIKSQHPKLTYAELGILDVCKVVMRKSVHRTHMLNDDVSMRKSFPSEHVGMARLQCQELQVSVDTMQHHRVRLWVHIY